MKLKTLIMESNIDYLRWKRKNVSFRGVKKVGEDNGGFASYGSGLYTAALSNKSMAKQYGDVYFVVNAVPKNPKIVNSVNYAEIWMQKVVGDFCKKHNREYDTRFFSEKTTIADEMLKLGFDGLVIKGREMVNYSPPENVKYFKTEQEVQDYYYLYMSA